MASVISLSRSFPNFRRMFLYRCTVSFLRQNLLPISSYAFSDASFVFIPSFM